MRSSKSIHVRKILMDCSKDHNELFERSYGLFKTIHGYDKTAFYCTKKVDNVRMIQQAFIVRKEWVMLE